MITIKKKKTKVSDLIHILDKIPLEKRNMVAEVTNNMRGIRDLIAMKCFPKTEIVADRFHVQKLASEAVREERIRLRREVSELNNSAIQKTRENGETHKQLIARSKFLLYKTKWTKSKIKRGDILFKRYPSIEKVSNLAQGFSHIFETNTNKDVARLKLAQWYNKVEKLQFKSFNTISRSIPMNYVPIMNYFKTEEQMLRLNLLMSDQKI